METIFEVKTSLGALSTFLDEEKIMKPSVTAVTEYIDYINITCICNFIWCNKHCELHILYGLVARLPGSHPGGSGSIPGTGILFFLIYQFLYF